MLHWDLITEVIPNRLYLTSLTGARNVELTL